MRSRRRISASGAGLGRHDQVVPDRHHPYRRGGPGRGHRPRIVFATIDRQNYVCPDNGLLSRLARRTPPEKIIRTARSEYWLQPVSATFHGRDIMAPVAARLGLGLDPDRLGPPQKSLVLIDEPGVRELSDGIEGAVLWVDSFGNLVTYITQTLLASHDPRTLRFRCNLRKWPGSLSPTVRTARGPWLPCSGRAGVWN